MIASFACRVCVRLVFFYFFPSPFLQREALISLCMRLQPRPRHPPPRPRIPEIERDTMAKDESSRRVLLDNNSILFRIDTRKHCAINIMRAFRSQLLFAGLAFGSGNPHRRQQEVSGTDDTASQTMRLGRSSLWTAPKIIYVISLLP